MSWFEKLMPSRISTEKRTRSVPEGVWIKCPKCDAQLYRNELERNLQVCPKCEHHMRIGARERLDFFLDPESEQELFAELEPKDPLKFRDSKRYRDRLSQAQKSTGEKDALVCASGTLFGRPIVACAFEFAFMGGSMGSVVGERFARAAHYAAENDMPLVRVWSGDQLVEKRRMKRRWGYRCNAGAYPAQGDGHLRYAAPA